MFGNSCKSVLLVLKYVRIYEEKIMAQRVSWLIPAMTDINESESRYVVMIKKHKCLDPNEKSSTAT